MITELDRGDPVTDRARRWALPVVTAACVIAFIGVALQPRSGAPAVGRAAPAAQSAASEQAPVAELGTAWQQTRDLASARRLVVETVTSLALPALAYTSVSRVVNSVTTGLFPADEEALLQLRYRLPDDRVAVLVRLPRTDPLRGIDPAQYTADSVIARGIEARLLSGRTTQPTILLWSEGERAYQLYSSALSGAELIRLAEQLR